MILSLAPLHGYTDSLYRSLLGRHFGGLDRVYAPFVSPTPGKLTPKLFQQFSPAEIPQLLGNDPDLLRQTAQYMAELGWKKVNLNLGCPAALVAAKKRGSGLLPYPQLIRQILDEVHRVPGLEWSVKLRLGRFSAEEFPPVLQVLKDFPLSEVVLHPRVGVQLYEGVPDYAALESLSQAPWPVHLSGDLNSPQTCTVLKDRFPWLTGLFLGRGLCANPFLAEDIKNTAPGQTPLLQWRRFEAFYQEWEQNQGARTALTPQARLKIFKSFWLYPCGSLAGGESWYWKLVQTDSPGDYQRQLKDYFQILERTAQEGIPVFHPYQKFSRDSPG